MSPINLEGRFSGLQDPEQEELANQNLQANRELQEHPELLVSAEQFKKTFIYDIEKTFLYPAEGEGDRSREMLAKKMAEYIKKQSYWQTRKNDVLRALFDESEYASQANNPRRVAFIDKAVSYLDLDSGIGGIVSVEDSES